jgi:hypothetical protein
MFVSNGHKTPEVSYEMYEIVDLQVQAYLLLLIVHFLLLFQVRVAQPKARFTIYFNNVSQLSIDPR